MPVNTRRNPRFKSRPSIYDDDDDHDHDPQFHKSKPTLNPNFKNRKHKTNPNYTHSKFLFITLLLAITAFSISMYYFIYSRFMYVDQNPRVITPFPSPKLMDLPQFEGEHKESLYWGTYRPHVYLGVRARTPQSLVAGLMWIGIKDGQFQMRHVCQDSDDLGTYGWTHHNGRDYGQQLIVDHGLRLETSFLKSKMEGSGYGGDWAVRIGVQSDKYGKEEEEMWKNGHIFFYVADEGGNAMSLSRDGVDIEESSLLASDSRNDIGSWQLHLKSADKLEVHFAGFSTPHIHNLSDLVQVNLAYQIRRSRSLQLSDTSSHSPNILVFQISARVPFNADLAFVSGADLKSSRVEERVSSLTGEYLSKQLMEKKREFDDKFESCFQLSDKVDSKSTIVGKAAISNMLGGIGYFYGQSKISVPAKSNGKKGDDYLLYWPAELYTAVPSRSFFPRGFLWDEGFHQLLIWRWDIHICLDIIGHWLDLLNIDGWIPREQILGAEALSKVPEEFVLQYPTNGNPPTLFLVLHDLVSNMKMGKFNSSQSHAISSFLDRAFIRLDAWFKWFNSSQSGKEPGSYFWHGRDNATVRELNPKTLSSGLDDYPRASHPSEDERHLDLRCWMLLASDCMHTILQLSQNTHQVKEYGSTAKLLSDFEILNQMHFDKAYGAYFDFGNHTEKVRLQPRFKLNENEASQELVRQVLQSPKLQFVPHVGYVSLFPFIAKIIPCDSWILEKQLELISNTSTLWTKYGIRSLSKTSSLYNKRNTEHDPPYWRGPVWMNMNYMILSALRHYSQVDGPYKLRAKNIYHDLRSNLIRNVVDNYHKTGYIWEQYDQKAGNGKGAHPFTGWSSLVLLIMSESYTHGWGVSIT